MDPSASFSSRHLAPSPLRRLDLKATAFLRTAALGQWCCRCCSIRSWAPTNPHLALTLHLTPLKFTRRVYLNSYSSHMLLNLVNGPLFQKEQGTCSFCEGRRRLHHSAWELQRWGCRKYLSSPGSSATLPEPCCWLVGQQELSASRCCRTGGQATGQNNLLPLHTHTDALPSHLPPPPLPRVQTQLRGQTMLSDDLQYTIEDLRPD